MELTDSEKPKAGLGEGPLKTAHLAIGIIMALAGVCITIGQSWLSRDEAARTYIRQDVYRIEQNALNGTLNALHATQAEIKSDVKLILKSNHP